MTLSPDEFRPLVELAAERASDGILGVDTEGGILYANDSAARMLGRAAAALCAQTVFDIAPEMNPALWRELWKEIRGHAAFSFEFTLRASDERLLQADMAVHHLRPGARDIACVFFRDIEERKRLRHLQQEFVSTASHELRTPMTVIREGVAQVVDGLRGDVNPSQHRALTLALNGIDRLGRIITDLLDISRIESGKIVLRRDRVDLAAVAREVGATFQSLANDRRLDLRVTTPAGPVMVYADRDRLVQVFTNLISNSFKFTERGSIQITVSAREDEAECAVTDTGMGLASADAEKIFNKFEQLGQAAVTGEKGTGLGLSISRGIVDLHHGRIWAESPGPGQGTRLAFVVPRQSGKEEFKNQLAPMLRHVSRRGGSLSAVVFHLETPPAAGVSEAQQARVLAACENLIRQQSGRKTDFLVRDAEAIYLALESTVKREAVRIADQIVNAFESHLDPEGLPAKFHLTYRIAGFPEEELDEDRYLQKVFNENAA